MKLIITPVGTSHAYRDGCITSSVCFSFESVDWILITFIIGWATLSCVQLNSILVDIHPIKFYFTCSPAQTVNFLKKLVCYNI
jgi:hypothetical protein